MLQCYNQVWSEGQCAKNQCHTANISTGRHAAGASYLCGEHQIERGLHDCLPSIAGRSCSSLLPLRQARSCRRISCGCVGVLITLQRYEKSERNANKNAFIFISERTSSSTNVLRLRLSTYGAQEGTTFLRHSQEMSRQISAYFLDLSGHIWTKVDNGSGNCRTFASSIRNDTQTGQDLLLGEGKIATQRSSRKLTPTPFRGGESETKNSKQNQTQAWKRSGMIALTAGQRKNDTY